MIVRCILLFLFTSTAAFAAEDATPYNILWLTGESLRPDHLGCYGYSRPTSPNIDALARRGVRFQACVSASSWTTESMLSSFLSLDSPVHGVVTRDRAVPADWTTPFEILAASGYLIPRMTDYQQPEQIAHRDLGYTEATVNNIPPWDWIAEHGDKPFLMWYHLYELHLPYNAPEPQRSLFWRDDVTSTPGSKWRVDLVQKLNIFPFDSINFFPEDAPAIRALYDGEVHEIDAKLGRILAALEAAGIADRTIVVLSADHGDGLLDHGSIGHTTTLFHGTLYDEVIHVPLIMALPDVIPEGREVSAQVRSIDIMPTLFELLRLPAPSYVMGESLVPLWQGENTEDRAAFSATSNMGYLEPDPEHVTHRWYSIRTPEWKLIRESTPEAETLRLFDLKHDPGERHDVSKAHPQETAALNGRIDAWLRECENTRKRMDQRRRP